MNNEIFKSERYFTVFDFVISHGQLLLRSSKDDDNVKNIDIIFSGTRYVQLFTSLSSISIKVVDKKSNLINYDCVSSFLSHNNNYLFEVETSNEKFYIGASNFKVYENELEFNETSLGLSELTVRGKEIAGSNL